MKKLYRGRRVRPYVLVRVPRVAADLLLALEGYDRQDSIPVQDRRRALETSLCKVVACHGVALVSDDEGYPEGWTIERLLRWWSGRDSLRYVEIVRWLLKYEQFPSDFEFPYG